MSTPYLRTNQRTSRVVVAPRSREATWPAKAVSPRLGMTYWGRTLRRSDTRFERAGREPRILSTLPFEGAAPEAVTPAVFLGDDDRFLGAVARGRTSAD